MAAAWLFLLALVGLRVFCFWWPPAVGVVAWLVCWCPQAAALRLGALGGGSCEATQWPPPCGRWPPPGPACVRQLLPRLQLLAVP